MSETAPPTDYAAARDHMVDSQVRPNKVIDPRIIRAMRRLPRERFLPPASACRAYADEDVPLPGGRAMIEPMVIARLVQLLKLREHETALVVAAGSGYGAALLDACGAKVTALEDDQGLLALARLALPAIAPGVSLVEGPVAAGWPAGAPYDVILIEGAVQRVPDILAAQLRAGAASPPSWPSPVDPAAACWPRPCMSATRSACARSPSSNVPARPCRSSHPARLSPSSGAVAHWMNRPGSRQGRGL